MTFNAEKSFLVKEDLFFLLYKLNIYKPTGPTDPGYHTIEAYKVLEALKNYQESITAAPTRTL